LTIFCRAPHHKAHGNGTGAPGAWTILCHAPSSTTHDKGHGPPCNWTILCRASRHVTHGKEYHRSRVSSAAHGKESVTPSPRRRPSTPFLSRASCIAHDKELCRVLPFPKVHGKGLCRAKMRRAPFAVRLVKSARQKSCCAYSGHCRASSAHGKARESGSDTSKIQCIKFGER
jgi:hypothetical protein